MLGHRRSSGAKTEPASLSSAGASFLAVRKAESVIGANALVVNLLSRPGVVWVLLGCGRSGCNRDACRAGTGHHCTLPLLQPISEGHAQPTPCGGTGGCSGATAGLAFVYVKHHGLATDQVFFE